MTEKVSRRKLGIRPRWLKEEVGLYIEFVTPKRMHTLTKLEHQFKGDTSEKLHDHARLLASCPSVIPLERYGPKMRIDKKGD